MCMTVCKYDLLQWTAFSRVQDSDSLLLCYYVHFSVTVIQTELTLRTF